MQPPVPAHPRTPQQVELFVIQRCWHSGPHVEPSVDCRRLFTSRREAEEVAYHSAHEFAQQSIFASSNGNSANTAKVKTLCLPPSSNVNGTASLYAFATCGKLFWVRSVKATIVPQANNMMMFGNSPLSFDKAEVVFTEGIIGGTGNRNSRRGCEAIEGRVFCSMDMAAAKRSAIEALTQLHMTHRLDINISVDQIPIGKASYSMKLDWPPSQRLVQQQLQYGNNGNSMMQEDNTTAKREWTTDPNPNLPSKRQCKLHRQEPQEQAVSCSMMF